MLHWMFYISKYSISCCNFFYYIIYSSEQIEEWCHYYAKEIVQEKNYLHDKFLDAGALRPYIINMIYEASKIVVERYEKEHNDMSLN